MEKYNYRPYIHFSPGIIGNGSFLLNKDVIYASLYRSTNLDFDTVITAKLRYIPPDMHHSGRLLMLTRFFDDIEQLWANKEWT